MYPEIRSYCETLARQFAEIPEQRKRRLEIISQYMRRKIEAGQTVNLLYICTHNSRRSHFGQIWAAVAASYYVLPGVHSFSGGTEVTAFNDRAIATLKRLGFRITKDSAAQNSVYQVRFDEHQNALPCFSKLYHDPVNPVNNFAAIMTCSEADDNCPFIDGADLRIPTSYDDPKAFDDTPSQDSEYDKRCRQIALETFYVFERCKNEKIPG